MHMWLICVQVWIADQVLNVRDATLKQMMANEDRFSDERLRRVGRCCVARKSKTSSRSLAWIWTESPKLNVDPSHHCLSFSTEVFFFVVWYDDLKWGTMQNWRGYDMVPSWSWQIRWVVWDMGCHLVCSTPWKHGWNHRIPMDRTSRDFCTLDWKGEVESQNIMY